MRGVLPSNSPPLFTDPAGAQCGVSSPLTLHPCPQTPQVLSEERVTGTVTTELTAGTPAQHGRISYENRGECFFLPYDQEDIEGNVTLRVGDLVSFQMATNPRSVRVRRRRGGRDGRAVGGIGGYLRQYGQWCA